ncbi:MAG: 4-hydroxyphenylacetate 3-hydroxylase N-terminal domain-containing protein, partial [Bdellovibrionia bacterium]
ADTDQIVAFFVQPSHPGLKLNCRRSYWSREETPHPLAAFDEIDSCLVFENAFIPADRVLYAGDADIARRISATVIEVCRHSFSRRLAVKFRLFSEIARGLVEAIGVKENRLAMEAVYTAARDSAMMESLIRDAEANPQIRMNAYPLGCRPDPVSINLAIKYGIERYDELRRSLERLGGQAGVMAEPDNNPFMSLARDLTGSTYATRQSLLEYYALGGAANVNGVLANALEATSKPLAILNPVLSSARESSRRRRPARSPQPSRDFSNIQN